MLVAEIERSNYGEHLAALVQLRQHGEAALPAALAQTGQMTSDVVGMLWRMVTGKASLQNISGPITIARVANGSAQLGPAWFLNFLAILSLSLCIMNLLPIPVLDGGHLLYYLIELVKGSPVGERALVAGQYVGLALLASLMGLAFYNDILRLGS
jgi:regulator of sigma E protease